MGGKQLDNLFFELCCLESQQGREGFTPFSQESNVLTKLYYMLFCDCFPLQIDSKGSLQQLKINKSIKK